MVQKTNIGQVAASAAVSEMVGKATVVGCTSAVSRIDRFEGTSNSAICCMANRVLIQWCLLRIKSVASGNIILKYLSGRVDPSINGFVFGRKLTKNRFQVVRT